MSKQSHRARLKAIAEAGKFGSGSVMDAIIAKFGSGAVSNNHNTITIEGIKAKVDLDSSESTELVINVDDDNADELVSILKTAGFNASVADRRDYGRGETDDDGNVLPTTLSVCMRKQP